MNRSFGMLVCALVFLLGPVVSSAGEKPHTHDGFFLRMCGGFGFGYSSVEDGQGADNTIRGGSNASNLAVGAMVSENLAIHADAFHVALIEPESFINGKSAGTVPGRYIAGGIGAGVTYYLMPSNLYLSGSLNFVVLEADIGGWRLKTDTGMGIDFLVGKEWWISDNWGIGVAGQFVYTLVPSQWDTTHNSVGGAVLFTATYN
jgi:hypothetical protein